MRRLLRKLIKKFTRLPDGRQAVTEYQAPTPILQFHPLTPNPKIPIQSPPHSTLSPMGREDKQKTDCFDINYELMRRLLHKLSKMFTRSDLKHPDVASGCCYKAISKSPATLRIYIRRYKFPLFLFL